MAARAREYQRLDAKCIFASQPAFSENAKKINARRTSHALAMALSLLKAFAIASVAPA
jgi:hypothetical protein